MALTDPQTLTVATIANTLPRVVTDKSAATYATASGDLKFSVSHIEGKRKRSVIRIDHSKISTDPFDVKSKVSSSAYILVDQPKDGSYTVQELTDIVLGLTKWATDGTSANLKKAIAGES